MTSDPASRRWHFFLPLLLLAAALFSTDGRITHVEDEVWVIHEAAQPVAGMLGKVLRGEGRHPHPPLSDLVLAGWVRLTDGAPRLVRIPSILFFLGGLWIWSLVAAHLAGPRGQLAALWLGALWPYGFHYGRLANWYALSFLLMGLVTLAYLRLMESRDNNHRLFFLASAIALLYTSFYGWVILACLGVDFVLRQRRDPATNWWALLSVVTILVLAFLPLWPELLAIARANAGSGVPLLERVGWLAAGAWTLFVSESVAPWIWWLGIPAAASGAVACAILARRAPEPARRMFFGGWLLLAGLALLGVGPPRRLLLLAGWMLAPAAVALVRLESRWLRVALAAALAVPAAVGWYGVVVRTHYFAPRFVEPWQQAVDAAMDARGRGAIIVANHPVFFYYLTHRLRDEQSPRPPFTGILPHSVYDRRVMDAPEFLNRHRDEDRSVLFVRGVEPGSSARETENALQALEADCLPLSEQFLLRDPGVAEKRRWLLQVAHREWRIEIRSYACVGDGLPSPTF
jgi:hypothetical protein